MDYQDIKSDMKQPGIYWHTTISAAASHQSNSNRQQQQQQQKKKHRSFTNEHASCPTHTMQYTTASYANRPANEGFDNMNNHINHAETIGDAIDNDVRVVVISSTSIAKQKGNNCQMLSHPTKEKMDKAYSTGVPGAPIRNKRTSYSLLARLSGLTLTGLSKNNNNNNSENGNVDPQRMSNGSASTSASSTRISLSRMFVSSSSSSSKSSDINSPSKTQSAPVQLESKFAPAKSGVEKSERRSLIPLLPQPTASQSTSVSSVNTIKKDIGIAAIIPTKAALKKVDKAQQEEIEKMEMIISRVGDLETAKYILSISKFILDMTSAGDKISKKAKPSKHANENVMTNGNTQGTNKSITSMIAEKIGFSQVSSIPRSPLTAHKKPISNPSNPQSTQSQSPNTQSNNLDKYTKKKSLDSLTLRFYGVKQPKISLDKYICRLVRYLNSYYDHEPGLDSTGIKSVIVAALYIDRIRDMNPDFVLNSMNVHRLLLAAVVVANKIMEDDHPSNEFMAGVGGVELKELNALEVSFCDGISFQLNVSFDETVQLYNKYGLDHPHILSEFISHDI